MTTRTIDKWLPIWGHFAAFRTCPIVLAEAKEVVTHGSRNGRPNSERHENSVQGLALQYAVAVHLLMLGNVVSRAPAGAYHYDLIVNGYYVDVKGRFTGKYWQQTDYEAKTIEETGDRVLYLCIDCFPETRPEENRFQYKGACWSFDLEKGMYQPYVKTFSEIPELILI